MKKYLSLFVLIAFFVAKSSCQDLIYYDALELYKTLENKKLNLHKTSSLAILKKYYTPKDSDENYVKHFQNNPFLRDILISTKSPLKNLSEIEGKTILPSSVLNLNTTNYNDAVTQLMVERFKEELTISFFNKLKDEFDDYPELKTLFPKTHEVILYITPENVYSMFSILRGAIENDLRNFLSALPGLRLKSKYATALNTEEGKLFVVSVFLLSGLQKGQNFGDIVYSLATDRQIEKDTSNIGNSVKLAGLVSTCFRDTLDSKIWISQFQLKSLVENETRLKIFMALIYEKNLHSKINFTKHGKEVFNLEDELIALSQQRVINSSFLRYLKKSYEKLEEIEANYDSLQFSLKNKKTLIADDYVQYSATIISYFKTTLEINKIDETVFIPDDFRNFTDLVNKGLEAYKDFSTRNYGLAVFNSMQLMDSTIFHNKENNDSRKILLKYAVFFANVAEAKNPDEVRLALEAVVSPVRASAIKTDSRFTISLNSYFGLFGGSEYLEKTKKYITTAGISAPIGLGLYAGLPKFKKSVGSLGVFVSVIDLGAVASFRLKKDSVERLPEMTLQNILAPGAYLHFGRIFDSPLTIGLGTQLAPQLRKVTVNGIESGSSSWRWNITISYDIPFFYFYRKTR